jgi:ATP-dependent helicase HepA
MKYKIGQRWFSEAEPELGLGIVENTEHKSLEVFYPGSDTRRTYSIQNAPLKRYIIENGEKLTTIDDDSFVVEDSLEENGIIFYRSGEQIIPEMILSAELELSSPLDRFFTSQADNLKESHLRYQSLINKRKYQLLKPKGFLSSKIELLPHQLSVATELSHREQIRCMLADEVGLGKTIEAALVINSLILDGRISSALILVPENLVNQWVVELMTKFKLMFGPISSDDSLGINVDIDSNNQIILSQKVLVNDEVVRSEINQQKWDIVVIDEAHQIINNSNSEHFSIINEITQKAKHLLLLTATPELLGPENLFLQLNLIDNEKYHTYETFNQSHKEYVDNIPLINKVIESPELESETLEKLLPKELVNKINNKNESIQCLIDKYGRGSSFFRNTRQHLVECGNTFPKRVLFHYELDKMSVSHITQKLFELHSSNKKQKWLIMANDEKLLGKIRSELLSTFNLQVAFFHSQLNPIERERRIVYFAQDDGAALCLCSDIGSEGRNFGFADHILFLDLPLIPDRLEQRIGRLDRIGHKNDVNIHILTAEDDKNHILFQWYKDVLNSFQTAPKGASHFYLKYRDQLATYIDTNELNNFQKFIEDATKEYKHHLCEIENKHDKLVDLNSFSSEHFENGLNAINEFTNEIDIKSYINQLADSLMFNIQDHDETLFHVAPSENMLIDYLPAIPSAGRLFADSRVAALKREDIDIISFEHPIVKELNDIIISTGIGNISFAKSTKLPSPIMFECIFTLEAIGSSESDIQSFFPMTPIRVLLDQNMKDITKQFPKKKLDSILEDVEHSLKEQIFQIPKENIKQFVEKAQQAISPRVKKYQNDFMDNFSHAIGLEIEKLKSSFFVDENHLKELENKRNHHLHNMQQAKLNLDSIKLMVKET